MTETGKDEPPYVVIRAPVVLAREQHMDWIENRCRDLKERGYTFFRASFPDDRPSELYVEGWLVKPKEQGPCPWEVSNVEHDTDHSSRPRGPGNTSDLPAQSGMGTVSERGAGTSPAHRLDRGAQRALVIDANLCLLDGSPVPNNPSYKKKRPDGQQTSYVRWSDQKLEATKPVRPTHTRMRHLRCMTRTDIHPKMAMTLARDPAFYKALFCAKCRSHFKIGAEGEFIWDHTDQKVGT